MKQVGTLVLWLMIVGGGWLKGQGCDSTGAVWANPGKTPTFLALIVGNYDRLDTATWAKLSAATNNPQEIGSQAMNLLHAGHAAAASALLAPRVATTLARPANDSSTSADALADLELAGIAALMQAHLPEADSLLAHAFQRSSDRLRCRLHTELLLVRYLEQFGMATPQMAHFNGGFFNFLQDSLGWNPEATDANGYVTALNTVAQLYRLDAVHGALYLELLGDLLSKEPNAFSANYLSSIAYLRAGTLVGGDGQAVYERKALFALEAPRHSEERFNQYRFTQLKKALTEDVDSAHAQQALIDRQDAQTVASGGSPLTRLQGFSTAPITVGFEATDRGRLPAMLAKSKAQLTARQEEYKRYAGDVDLKAEVKKDNRFNSFALFLIGSIIASAIIIWRKLLTASKKSE
jgi:hypothetical protein